MVTKVDHGNHHRKDHIVTIIVVHFQVLVTTMVTKVGHGNHRSNNRDNHRSNHHGSYDAYYNGNT